MFQVLAAPLPIQLPANARGKTVENGPSTVEDGPSAWVPAHMWETWKKLLAPGFGLAQLWPLQPFGE